MKLICESVKYIAFAIASNVLVCRRDVDQEQFHIFNSDDDSDILSIIFSLDEAFIFAAYSNKKVYCWALETKANVGLIIMKKRPTSMRSCVQIIHGKRREILIVSDKAGDISAIDVPSLKSQILIGGHTASVITDLLCSDNHIITCDRDEKIRITSLPHTEFIASYCLGHTNVITSLSFVTFQQEPLHYMVSSSWDDSIILWDYIHGKLLHRLSYTIPDTTDISNNDSNNVNILNTNDNTDNIEDNHHNETNETNNNNNNNNDNNDNDDMEDMEKKYDESSAGNYPYKVISTSHPIDSHIAVIAVIFRNLSVLKLYDIIHQNPNPNPTSSSISTNDPSLQFINERIITLNAIPIDILFYDSSYIIIIYDQPHYIQCLNIYHPEQSLQSNSLQAILNQFIHLCQENKATFTQQVVYSVDDHDSGIKKHNLDRPFNKSTGINYEKNSGSKRSSRKRRLGDAGVESEVQVTVEEDK